MARQRGMSGEQAADETDAPQLQGSVSFVEKAPVLRLTEDRFPAGMPVQGRGRRGTRADKRSICYAMGTLQL